MINVFIPAMKKSEFISKNNTVKYINFLFLNHLTCVHLLSMCG